MRPCISYYYNTNAMGKLPTIMVAWGIVMTLMGICQSYGGFLTARVFLGVAEAGLFPGVVYYNTQWYCRYEVQVRQAYFFSAASIAGAFSGLLAYGISYMDGVGELKPCTPARPTWIQLTPHRRFGFVEVGLVDCLFCTTQMLTATLRRWIFILEGIATVVIACCTYFLIHDSPETASFLSTEERAFIAFRLKYDGQDADTNDSLRVAQSDRFGWEFVRQAFGDWQIWFVAPLCASIVSLTVGLIATGSTSLYIGVTSVRCTA